MATPITPKMLNAMKAVEAEFDDLHALTIVDALHFTPKGTRQDCTVGTIADYEYCDQKAGMLEDSYHGTVMWKIDDKYLIAEF